MIHYDNYHNPIELHIGDKFSTPIETGCEVITEVGDLGNFDARDSEGVICTFNTRMVTRIYERI